MPKSSQLEVIGPADNSGYPRDRKISETRLAVLGDQNVVLDVPRISVRAHSILRSTYRTDATV